LPAGPHTWCTFSWCPTCMHLNAFPPTCTNRSPTVYSAYCTTAFINCSQYLAVRIKVEGRVL
jgi:hypothetical protein